MSRRRWIVLGVVVFALALLAAGTFFAFRDSATPVDAQELIDSGRGAVYVYDTAGFEEVSALGGGRHDYPPDTFLTVAAADCGVSMRWQALEERWEDHRFCDGMVTPITYEVYNEWFGRVELGQFTCSEPVPEPDLSPGATWEFECISPDTTEQVRYLVEGTETLEVGGETVDTVHLRIVSEAQGKTLGTMQIDEWRMPDSWLPVRVIKVDDSVTESLIGDVTYHEEFTLTLRSLQPTGG